MALFEAALYILAAGALAWVGYEQRRSVRRLGNGVSVALTALTDAASNPPGTHDATDLDARRAIEELKIKLGALERLMNDLDESTERRFRRMSARARRADDAEAEQEEALQGQFPFRTAAESGPGPNPRRMLRRQR
jgi:hypothetical protein